VLTISDFPIRYKLARFTNYDHAQYRLVTFRSFFLLDLLQQLLLGDRDSGQRRDVFFHILVVLVIQSETL
jgi:hypothetical protein